MFRTSTTSHPLAISQNLPSLGLVFLGASASFHSRRPQHLVNQRHNVLTFSRDPQLTIHAPQPCCPPRSRKSSLNFAPAVLGKPPSASPPSIPTHLPSTSSSERLDRKESRRETPSKSVISALAGCISRRRPHQQCATGPWRHRPASPAQFLEFRDNSSLPAALRVADAPPAARRRPLHARSAPSTCSPTPRNPGSTRLYQCRRATRRLSLLGKLQLYSKASAMLRFRCPCSNPPSRKTIRSHRGKGLPATCVIAWHQRCLRSSSLKQMRVLDLVTRDWHLSRSTKSKSGFR